MNTTLLIVALSVVAMLSATCTDVRESLTGPTAVTGAPMPGQLRQAPVEILDRAPRNGGK